MGARSRSAWLQGILAILIVVALATPALARHGKHRYHAPPPKLKTLRTQKLSDGLTLTYLLDPTGPNRLFLLTIDPDQATLDLVTAGGPYPSTAPVSRMGQRAGALAAVNGSMFVEPGQPRYILQADGEFLQSGLRNSKALAISQDQDDIQVEPARPQITLTEASSGKGFKVNVWNSGSPKGGQVAAFTTLAVKMQPPPTDSCYALLGSAGDLGWNSGRTAIEQTYGVEKVECRAKPLALGDGEVLLVGDRSGDGESDIRSLSSGDKVTVAWASGWRNVLDIAGGSPILLKDGKVTVSALCNDSFCGPQPRTGVGYDSDGNVLILVVDGGQGDWSKGMTLEQWAEAFQQLGAERAINLDGGGSTTLWADGMGVVDRPSNPDNAERPVAMVVVVLAGKDAGEPASLK